MADMNPWDDLIPEEEFDPTNDFEAQLRRLHAQDSFDDRMEEPQEEEEIFWPGR